MVTYFLMKMAKRHSIYIDKKNEELLNHIIEDMNHEQRIKNQTKLKNGVVGLKYNKKLSMSQVVCKLMEIYMFDKQEYLSEKLDEHARMRDLYEERLSRLLKLKVTEPKTKSVYSD